MLTTSSAANKTLVGCEQHKSFLFSLTEGKIGLIKTRLCFISREGREKGYERDRVRKSIWQVRMLFVVVFLHISLRITPRTVCIFKDKREVSSYLGRDIGWCKRAKHCKQKPSQGD